MHTSASVQTRQCLDSVRDMCVVGGWVEGGAGSSFSNLPSPLGWGFLGRLQKQPLC